MAEVQRWTYRLFVDYDVDDLVDRTGYSREYLRDIKVGVAPLTRKFRRKIAKTLRRADNALFSLVHDGDEPAVASPL